MQQPAVPQPALSTEAMIIKGPQSAAGAAPVAVSGEVAVGQADAVYLDLSAERVAMAVREGDDLILTDVEGQVLRLTGFYEGRTARQLFLKDDDDQVVQLAAQAVSDGPLALSYAATGDSSPFESRTSSESTVVAGAGLGGAAGALLGLAVAGGLAIAAGGGGGGGGGDDGGSRPPVDTTPPGVPTNLQFDATGGRVTGSGEVGATVTIRNSAGAAIGSGQVGADGTFSVALNPPLINREQVTVVLTDAAGNASGPGTATAPDLTAPPAPTNVDVSDNGAVVTGRGEPGASVTVRDAVGAVIGTGVVAADGGFSVTLTTPLINGEEVRVVLTDAAGNASGPGTATAPDLTAPPAPTNVDVSDNGAVVTGRGEPGASVTVRDAAGAVIGTGVVAPDGGFSVTLTTPLINGEEVRVVLTDAAGNASGPGTATAPDLTAPFAPADVQVSPSGDGVTGAGEAGATVTVRGPNGAVIGTGVVGSDGRFTIPLTTPLIDSERVRVSQADPAGNVSPEVTAIAPDLIAPGGPNGTDAPVVLIGEAQGGINAAELADGVQARVQLTPGSQAGDRLILTAVSGGAPVVVEHILLASEIAAGIAELVLPATLADGAYGVSAVISDGRGNASQVSPTVNILVDTITPAPVIQTANGQGLSGTAEAGAAVTLVNAQGAAIVGAGGAPVTVTAGADGAWTIPGTQVPGGLDGFVGGVRAVDAAGNAAQTGVGPIDGSTPAPVITAQNGTVIEGAAEAGARLSLLDADGDPVLGADGQPITVVVDASGNWSIPGTALPGGLDGFVGSVRAVDPAGNSAVSPVGPIDGAVDLSINIDAVTADNVVNIAEAGAASVAITGRAIGEFVAGQTVTVTLSNGVVQTGVLGADGRWSVSFAGADLAASTSLTATTQTTDDAGNSVTVTDTQAYGLDLIAPPAPIVTGANGQGVSGTGEPGVTLNLLNASGAVIATTLVGQDGRWSIPSTSIPGPLNGFVGSAQTVDAAGNAATAPVGPVDGITVAPVVTAANGQALTGTGEAGATITLLDPNGQPVRDAAGAPVTTVVGPDGAWTLPVAGVAGGLDGFTGAVRATDPAGNHASTPVGPIDGATLAPVITGANASGLSGLAEPGAVILLDSNGAPVLDAAGLPVRAVVAPDGTWTIPADSVPGGLDGFSGSVRAVDPAGNTAETAFGPIDGSVSVTLVVDPITADNVVNLVESQGAVSLTGRAIGEFAPGQTVTVTLPGGVVLTTSLGADGRWSVSAPGSALAAGGEVTASTQTTDSSGNSVVVEGRHTYGVDLTVSAPVITTANGQGVSGTAEAGVTVALLNSAGVVLGTVTAGAGGAWTFPASLVPGGIEGFAGSVRATDAAGNTAVTPLTAVDGSTPAPVIQTANGQGLSGTAEAGAAVTLVNAQGAAIVGAGGAPVTVTAGADGAWTIPGTQVPGGLDGFVGGVRAVDAAGNAAQTGVGPIDGSTPAPVITAQNGTVIEGAAEAGARLSLLDADGDPVLGADGQPITVVVDASGNWSIPGTALPGGLDGFVGSVRAVDPAGNSAVSPVGPIDGAVDLSINIDAVTADNVVNIAEAGAASVAITGRAIGEFVAGQTVTVTLSNGVVQTGVLGADGRWSVSFAGADLAASTSLTATTQTTDDAGNSVTVTDTQVYGLDLIAPPAPIVTGANGQGVSGTGEPGVTLNLLNASGAVIATTLVGQDGRWSIPSTSIPGPLNGFVGSAQTVDAAGNAATAPVGPVDGITVAPVVTAANGQALTGTGEAGATITFFGTGGGALLGANGQPVTAVVNGSGVWTLPAAAVPGGLDGFTGTARATDAAGNTATGAVGPIDGATPAPVITSANGLGLAGTAENGAVISLLDASGAPRLDAAGNPIRVVADADGRWSIPASEVPGGLDGFTGRVAATDAAGNAASTAVGPVDGVASLSLVVDGVTADNVVNGAEAGQAAVTVTGRATGDAQAGDEVRVELSTGVFRTVMVGAGGAWSATFTGAELAAGVSVTATSTATDAAGNRATASTTQTYRVDLDTTAPAITSANGAGLAGTAEAGATITILGAGGAVVGTAVADGTGAWSLAGTALTVPINGFTGTVRATDPAGNTAETPVGPIDGTVNLLLSVDPVTPDNVLNIAEAAGTVTLGGAATGEFRAGDVVTVSLSNGAVQTAVLGADGRWSVSFSGADLAASNGVRASITTTDGAGNPATIVQDRAYAQDLTAPTAPTVTSAGVGGLVGTGEPGATILLSTTAGVPVLGSSGDPVTAIVNAGGGWTVPASAFPGGAVPADFSGRVVAVDAAGNPSTPTVIAPIDVTPPNETTTSVAIDVIAGDDIVNLAESQGTVTITGLVTGEFRTGDAVTVTAGAAVYSGTVGADGRWSVTASGAALTGGSLLATVRATDAAGNVGTITGTRAYTQDLVGPGGAGGLQAPGLTIPDAADGLINPTEFSDGVSAVVVLTPATQVGDTVVVTLTAGGASQTFTAVVTQAARDAGQISVAIETGLADGRSYTATAVIRDPAGNPSATGAGPAFTVDTVPIAVGATTVALSEGAVGAPVTGNLAVTGANGAVTYTLQAPDGTFTSRGQTVTWAVEPGGALVGSAGGQAVVRATISASGAYSISLLGPLDHPAAGADSLQLPIRVTAADAGGSSQSIITVNVADSVPSLAPPVSLSPTQPGVIVGDFVQSFGPDGGSLTSVTIDGRTFAYNPSTGAVTASGSSPSILTYSVTNGVLTATTLRGEAISVNFNTGDYRVEVSGQDASLPTANNPNVALGGVTGLLGLLDANALGLIQLSQQQFFSASDVNNDLSVVTLTYNVALSVGAARFTVNSALAAELGLTAVVNNTGVLNSTSTVTIRAADNGLIDNLRLNELLGTITLGTGGLADLLSLSLGQTLSIGAQDSGGRQALASETNLANLGVLSDLLGGSQPSQILTGTAAGNTITASDVGTGAALDNRVYGYGGDDTLNGGLGNDILRGGAGADTLNGGSGNDLLIGGTGNDVLTGGAGVDVFRWERGDQGVSGAPAADVITDFNVASVNLGGDVLDLSSLLVGEGRIGLNPGNLTNYLHFEQTSQGTLIRISTTGGFTGGYGSVTSNGETGDQTILLSNVNLTSGFGSDQAILADLLARGKLIVDTLPQDGSTVPNTLLITATARDGDGDTGSTSLTIDSSNVAPRPSVPGNSAPVVELNAQNLLASIAVGSGLTMGSQDLLAADADGNLARVEVEYAPLVAVNLTPLTFGYSSSLAAAYGLDVRVTQSNGLLGVVAPSARISIAALDGGVIDNIAINRFLESIYLADSGGGLLSSSLLSVNLLNALTIRATDAEGLSSSQVVGSAVTLGLLNSLDGPDPVVGALAEAEGKPGVLTLPAEPEVAADFAAKGHDQPLVLPDAEAHGKALIDQPLVLPQAEPELDAGLLRGLMTPGGHSGDFQLQVSEDDAVSVPDENAFFLVSQDGGEADFDGEISVMDLLRDLDIADPDGDDILHLFPAEAGGEGLALAFAEPDVLNQPLTEDATGYDPYVAPLPVLEDPTLAHS